MASVDDVATSARGNGQITAAEPSSVPDTGEALGTAVGPLREALTAIRRVALAQVAAAWSVVTVEELARTIPLFAALAALAVVQGQRSAVRFADAWFAGLTRGQPRGLDPDPFLGLSGTTAPLPVVLAGAASASVRHALIVGYADDEALRSGLARAERITATEVYGAGTSAVAVLGERSGSPGWRRQLGPKACPICVGLAAGEPVRPWADGVAAHPHCSCLPEPVLAPET